MNDTDAPQDVGGFPGGAGADRAEDLIGADLPSTSRPPVDASTMADLGRDDVCRRWMALQTLTEPELDGRGQAAYLVNAVSNAVSGTLVALDLCGRDAAGFGADDIAVRATHAIWTEDGEEEAYLHHDLWVTAAPNGAAPSAEALERAYVRIFSPLVFGAARCGPISEAALWRLVADACAAAYLNQGGRVGCLHPSMARAEAILGIEGSPLCNSQLRYGRIEIQAEEAPGGRTLRKWFRYRGGCCRWYTVPTGELCGTCVLRKDRDLWFRNAMLRHNLSDPEVPGHEQARE